MPPSLSIEDAGVVEDVRGPNVRTDNFEGRFQVRESSGLLANASEALLPNAKKAVPIPGRLAQHTLGLLLLLLVVFLWTTSNFLGSTIFADNTYAKPFFLTYLNTSVFVLALIPVFLRKAYHRWANGMLRSSLQQLGHDVISSDAAVSRLGDGDPEHEAFLNGRETCRAKKLSSQELIDLDVRSTTRLALRFSILWFLANYFAAACLQYTTVASATILTSTSSIWTLLIGALTRTEKFTWRKLLGVLASVAGVFLISRVDLSSPNPRSDPQSSAAMPANVLTRKLGDSFPEKAPLELAFGDAMAGLSALIYGVYTITLKRTSDQARKEGKTLNMPLFFGLVGLINAFLLLPLFPILSILDIETYQAPPNQRIWTILLINSFACLLSDICWAYAMVLTGPLVVTVGLSLTIPLSLVGELVLQGRSESFVYWIGAAIVVCSFVFVERENVQQERQEEERAHPS